MGTRFVVEVMDGEKVVGRIYGQYDGYPKGGLPYELLSFLSKRTLVNGISNREQQINGADDMVAMIFAYLKIMASDDTTNLPDSLGAGTIYAYDYDPLSDWAVLYTYIIHADSDKIPIKVGELRVEVYHGDEKIFDGPIDLFLANYGF